MGGGGGPYFDIVFSYVQATWVVGSIHYWDIKGSSMEMQENGVQSRSNTRIQFTLSTGKGICFLCLQFCPLTLYHLLIYVISVREA